jgi:putative oxidoreductase
MKSFISNKYLLLFIRLVLGGLFIYSAALKIIDVSYFAKSLYNYRILPVETLNLFALIIPWLELVIGLLLVPGIFVKENALLGSILIIIFIAAIASAVARNLDIDCGCFGTRDGTRVGLLKIIEDLFILLGFIWIAIYGSDFLALTKSKNIRIDKPESYF